MRRFSPKARNLRHKILDLVLDIQEQGDYAQVNFANFGWDIDVSTMIGPFDKDKKCHVHDKIDFSLNVSDIAKLMQALEAQKESKEKAPQEVTE